MSPADRGSQFCLRLYQKSVPNFCYESCLIHKPRAGVICRMQNATSVYFRSAVIRKSCPKVLGFGLNYILNKNTRMNTGIIHHTCMQTGLIYE